MAEKHKERTCFLLYHNFYNQFELLPMEERGKLITAIFKYAMSGTVEDDMPDMVKMAFSIIKFVLDKDHESYIAKCERNAQNGKKGGRPKGKTSNEKTERFFLKPKKPDMDMDMGMDKDMDKDMDMDIDMDMGMDMGMDMDMEAQNAVPLSEVPTPPVSDAVSPTAPLEEYERDILISKGIPEQYIDERADRAEEYGRTHGMSAYETLQLWWKADRTRPPWNTPSERGRYTESVSVQREREEQERKNKEMEEWFYQRLENTFGP